MTEHDTFLMQKIILMGILIKQHPMTSAISEYYNYCLKMHYLYLKLVYNSTIGLCIYLSQISVIYHFNKMAPSCNNLQFYQMSPQNAIPKTRHISRSKFDGKTSEQIDK